LDDYKLERKRGSDRVKELREEMRIVRQIHKQKTLEQRQLMIDIRDQHAEILQLDDECRRLELLC
jgi:hypothetical protein